jgi:hypothetical protein
VPSFEVDVTKINEAEEARREREFAPLRPFLKWVALPIWWTFVLALCGGAFWMNTIFGFIAIWPLLVFAAVGHFLLYPPRHPTP